MKIFLHLRYPVLYSAEKARKLIGILAGFCCLAYVFATIRIKTMAEMRTVLALYVWPLLVILVIVSSLCVYIYIQWKYSHRRPQVSSSRSPVQSGLSRRANNPRKLLLLPTLLIASFFVFAILPALFIFLLNVYGTHANSGTKFVIVNSFYMIGTVMNAVAYVLVYPPIRRFILLKRARLLGDRRSSIFVI